jgi:hypothetical protein
VGSVSRRVVSYNQGLLQQVTDHGKPLGFTGLETVENGERTGCLLTIPGAVLLYI